MSYNLTTMQSIFLNNKEITLIKHNNKTVYQKQSGPDYTEPFYVENISNADETLSIVKSNTNAPTLTIEYSTDKTTWTPFENPTSTTALTYTLQPNDKLYLRCNTNVWYASYSSNNITGISKVGGNVMSLLYGSSFTGQETSFPSTNNYALGGLFDPGYNKTSILQNASDLLLPATTLASYCYSTMFQRCNSLTAVPVLPATTLASSCYSSMFQNCSSLTTAPALPAITLANYCYQQMFRNCTNLNFVKCLAETTANGATNKWLNGVSTTGVFIKSPDATFWDTGTSGIPSGWTVNQLS